MKVYTGEINKGFFEEEPMIFFDGVPMGNPEKLFSYDPLKVKSIEVLPKKYFYGRDIYGGIIMFNTYKINLEGMDLGSEVSVIDYEGLQLIREFYSPLYDTPERLKSRLPDFRNLLYWSPDITTPDDGKLQFSFYTSDRPVIYTTEIQVLLLTGSLEVLNLISR